MKTGYRTIFHIDMDAFFASVEQRDFPAYRGKPVIVGANVGTRGVVSTASYEARKFGIHSAMPISEAYRRCPGGIFVQPRMAVYENVSRELMTIFSHFTPKVEQVSVDEAFLDMSGTGRLFGTPLEVAAKIADTICTTQHLTASIGIAPNKFCAKIASDMHKPQGITVCPNTPAAIIDWLAPMAVGEIWGVGRQTESALNSMGIATIADLQKLSLEKLTSRFGKSGGGLYYLARGIDNRPVCTESSYKSISREHTFNVDSKDREEWQSIVFNLTQDVARRARQHGVKGSTVFITWRRPDFVRHTRQKALFPPTNVARFIFEEAQRLLSTVDGPQIRLIGVGITGLDMPLQTDLFGDDTNLKQWENSEKAVDVLTGRFGGSIIKKGRELAAEQYHEKSTAPVARKKIVSHNKHQEREP